MNPHVVVTQHGRRPLHVVVADRLEIGRECDGLLICDERASRRHLRLEVSDEGLLVIDLGSSNGTFLDGTRLDGPVVLDHNSTVRVGSTSIRLHPETPQGPSVTFPMSNVAPYSTPGSVADPRPTVAETIPEVQLLGAEMEPVIGLPADAGQTVRQTGIELVARAVVEQRPPLGQRDPAGDDTVTIVFSDIEASTELATALGDEGWYRRLSHHNEIVESCVARGGGRIVKNQGDGYMMTFSSARRALLTAAAIQNDLGGDQADGREPIRVRIGCHTGEAIQNGDGDLFGQHVIIAARVADLALGGEVLVSSIAKEITAARGDLLFGEARSVSLKGISGSHVVHEFDWRRATPGPRASSVSSVIGSRSAQHHREAGRPPSAAVGHPQHDR